MSDSDVADVSIVAPSEDLHPRHRRLRPAIFGAVAIVITVAVIVTVQYQPVGSSVRRSSAARTAPTFEVADLRDEAATIDLRDLRGRPVVLNFWASWCVPCRKEMPAFQAVHRRTGDDVAFLGINHQDSRDDALDLLRSAGVSYPSGFDPKGSVARAYGLYGMPTTVFISTDGRILATRTGELTESQLSTAITELFEVRVAHRLAPFSSRPMALRLATSARRTLRRPLARCRCR